MKNPTFIYINPMLVFIFLFLPNAGHLPGFGTFVENNPVPGLPNRIGGIVILILGFFLKENIYVSFFSPGIGLPGTSGKLTIISIVTLIFFIIWEILILFT